MQMCFVAMRHGFGVACAHALARLYAAPHRQRPSDTKRITIMSTNTPDNTKPVNHPAPSETKGLSALWNWLPRPKSLKWSERKLASIGKWLGVVGGILGAVAALRVAHVKAINESLEDSADKLKSSLLGIRARCLVAQAEAGKAREEARDAQVQRNKTQNELIELMLAVSASSNRWYIDKAFLERDLRERGNQLRETERSCNLLRGQECEMGKRVDALAAARNELEKKILDEQEKYRTLQWETFSECVFPAWTSEGRGVLHRRAKYGNTLYLGVGKSEALRKFVRENVLSVEYVIEGVNLKGGRTNILCNTYQRDEDEDRGVFWVAGYDGAIMSGASRKTAYITYRRTDGGIERKAVEFR
jgi:hypothetical protein